jgi:hypothetical protein
MYFHVIRVPYLVPINQARNFILYLVSLFHIDILINVNIFLSEKYMVLYVQDLVYVTIHSYDVLFFKCDRYPQ